MSSRIVTFNNERIFGNGEHTVQPLSWRREMVERGFAGLDGVVSTDLGLRERKLKQCGYISAESVAAVTNLLENISAYIDGLSYDLVDQNGVSYSDIRMDSFTLSGPIGKGSQARCDYEIIYTQLSSY